MQSLRTITPFLLPLILLVVFFVYITMNKSKNSDKGSTINTFLLVLVMNTIIITFPLFTIFKIPVMYIEYMFLFNIVVNYTAFKQFLKYYNKENNKAL